jgi:acyl-CoA reductase-like NAD-dependent aldehyde dehydrogenase
MGWSVRGGWQGFGRYFKVDSVLADTRPLYLANRPLVSDGSLPVRDKYSGEQLATVALADDALMGQAVAAAVAAAPAMRAMAPYERQAVLLQCAREFEARADELAAVLVREAGKPVCDSRDEVSRLVETFSIAAAEAVRLDGEVMNLELGPRSRGYRGFWQRVPAGPCAFISPFNFPLNLVAHKVAPAIAAGCPFVLKPASRTPLSALLIGEVLAGTALPPGAFSILPCSRETGLRLVRDERIRLLSFTGSPAVGWSLQREAGGKKVVLELGGNAACIVDADADLEDAVERIVHGAFSQAGQSCISVQRIMVHERVYDDCRARLVAATRALVSGDPADERVTVGPLIDEAEAVRLSDWIAQAVAAGARLLCGGQRSGALLEPTLLEDVPPAQSVCAREAFGPVAVLSRFADFDEALAQANTSRYGLQAGVFTGSLAQALKAWEQLEVGGVVVGDIPSWRGDNMPYGGVKDSGLGREGVRFALQHMTEIRNLVIRDPGWRS